MAEYKERVKEKKTELMRLTKDFSQAYLNEEYDEIIEKLINKMARKREVPFVAGKIEIWAAAVIHALGTINFLFDKQSQPYATVDDINTFFNTKKSTTGQKSKKIRDMFKMSYFDNEFATASIQDNNPFDTWTMINDFFAPRDPVKEEEQDELVMIDEMEVVAAQIIAGKELNIEKLYMKNDLIEMLGVTHERQQLFYNYLFQHMSFPFPAVYEEEVGPLQLAGTEVTCVGLDQKMKVDEFYGILVECRDGKKKTILPLADIIVDKNNENSKFIEIYSEWLWVYS
ncbi:DUF6398 domain-containing protein [Salibacterium qingdaonense]|uniref:Calcium binding n=1 Tax=Salibacterium qingdaonense TaxID=266892 RepID=A0A1I4KHV6_9BACI|nr:DUF6398 domain-containing protein [Salibacterium qingdaonense]SFL78027.1 Calcium binding [Salibacterium qingdaonense]